MSFFPKDPKKLRARIRSYERALKAPNCDDGFGKRFLVGAMYLLVGDLEGALRYYTWYTEHFPDDGVEPLNHACWALALYRSHRVQEAESKLKATAMENPHVWDWLYGGRMDRWDIWYGTNFSEPEYLAEASLEYLDLWNFEELEWAHRFSMSAPVAMWMEEATSIRRRLKNLPPGAERSKLVTRLFEMRNPEFKKDAQILANVVHLHPRGESESETTVRTALYDEGGKSSKF